jgi:hypothetical protein
MFELKSTNAQLNYPFLVVYVVFVNDRSTVHELETLVE